MKIRHWTSPTFRLSATVTQVFGFQNRCRASETDSVTDTVTDDLFWKLGLLLPQKKPGYPSPAFMLSLERTKQLLNNPALSDEKVEEIRDAFRSLAEVIFEQWQMERPKNKKSEQRL